LMPLAQAAPSPSALLVRRSMVLTTAEMAVSF
jgi:hypothetical protein